MHRTIEEAPVSDRSKRTHLPAGIICGNAAGGQADNSANCFANPSAPAHACGSSASVSAALLCPPSSASEKGLHLARSSTDLNWNSRRELAPYGPCLAAEGWWQGSGGNGGAGSSGCGWWRRVCPRRAMHRSTVHRCYTHERTPLQELVCGAQEASEHRVRCLSGSTEWTTAK